MTVIAHLGPEGVARAEVLRTARKLMDGIVFPREDAADRLEAAE